MRIGLVLGITFILLSCGFLPAIGQDSPQNPPGGYDKGVWVLTNKTPYFMYPNSEDAKRFSVSGNSITVRKDWMAHCSPEGDRPAYYLGTGTWTEPPSVLYPGTKLETIMTVSMEGNPAPCSDGSWGNPAVQGFGVTLHNNVINNWMEVRMTWTDTKPAPNSQKVTWDVPEGTTGKTITIQMEFFDVYGRASVHYTYTYQEQKASTQALPPTDKEAENHPPTVTLSYSPSDPTDQDLIEFTAEASDPDGDELTYSWFCDDEEQSDTGSTVGTTLSPGDHTVTVKVSDGKGGTDEDSVHFTVTPSSGISGDVLEAVYLQPITDATVTVEDSDGNVIRKIPVDENGKYSVLLPPGTYRVWASAPGYLPSTGMSGEHVEVTAGKISDWINFRLVMEPTNGGKPEISTKSFEFAGWGAYRFADISGKRYFAAYLEEPTQKMLDAGESIPYLWQKSNGRDLQKNGQFSEVLMDDNEERTLTSGESLKLEEGYELAIKAVDIDGRKVYLELSRDGVVVDSKVIRPFLEYQNMEDRTYYYKSNIGGTKKIVQIAVYFMYAFGSAGFLVQDDAGIGGVFQISDTPRDI